MPLDLTKETEAYNIGYWSRANERLRLLQNQKVIQLNEPGKILAWEAINYMPQLKRVLNALALARLDATTGTYKNGTPPWKITRAIITDYGNGIITYDAGLNPDNKGAVESYHLLLFRLVQENGHAITESLRDKMALGMDASAVDVFHDPDINLGTI